MLQDSENSTLTDIAPKEDPLAQRCRVELFKSDETTWNDIKDDILRIERAHFEEPFEEEEFVEAFNNPEILAVLLKDTETGHVVGFTYALPAEISYNKDFHPERLNEVKALDSKVAYIEDTAIDPEYMGHRLVVPLISTLEEALVNKGYGYFDRDSAVKHNYATNIAKIYGDRIIASHPHESKYGDQVFFRIRL